MTERRANADSTELAKFEALAGDWWDPAGPFKTLHEINPLRVAYVDDRVHLNGARTLDVGCGGGLLSEALSRKGAEVVGIDLTPTALAKAKAHASDQQLLIDYREIDAETLASQAAETFDIVTCMELLEHVPAPGEVVRACASLVRPGGSVFFSTINRNFASFLTAIVAAEHVLDLVPRGTHEYAKLIRPSELGAWCRAAGLNLMDITALQYNPLTLRHRLGGRPLVNYLCYATRPEKQ